jgi:hypothetical protein
MDTSSPALRAKARNTEMTAKISSSAPALPTSSRLSPVRVKLQRKSCDVAKVHPPDGDGKVWWSRLKKALGTSSSDFVQASLFQLQGAARLPGGSISELAVNSALALIEAAQPKNEIEGALAVQMACTHTASMAILARLQHGYPSERRTPLLAAAASRLLKAYSMQVDPGRRNERR